MYKYFLNASYIILVIFMLDDTVSKNMLKCNKRIKHKIFLIKIQFFHKHLLLIVFNSIKSKHIFEI